MRARYFLIVLVGTLLVSIPPSSNAAQMTPAFGPKQYTRSAGRPQTFTDTFQHCGTTSCQIVVTNGNPNGTGRISSASIFLNDVQMAGQSDFNQQVATIVKPVVLADQNQLTIRLGSNPGGFLTIKVECAASAVNLTLGAAGVNLLDPATLLSAVPIANTGTASAENVQLNNVLLPGATLTVPASLPFGLGTIVAGGSVVLNTEFTGGFVALGSYPLQLSGTYAVGAATYCFELTSTLVIPPAAPGSTPLGSVLIPSNQVSGAPVSFSAA